ncbi:Hypothetical predicted protein [Pelobates cultripes]|uniref:Uncharacterized protein n=1 Tax=Pelobates cultripes TaxID=61616 RepID=A0AAD1SLM0_PELCU|nr:Hypothetical predicted protein [Pelobates cultripes]
MSMAGSTQGSPAGDALTQISADLAVISMSMLTQRDKVKMVAELWSIIREEITAVRNDLAALEQWVDDLEVDRLQSIQHRQATDFAATRQDNIILDLRRQVEDLNNRGSWNNLRMEGNRHMSSLQACSPNCSEKRPCLTSVSRVHTGPCGPPEEMAYPETSDAAYFHSS